MGFFAFRLAPHASRLAVKRVRVDEIFEKKNK